VGEVFTRRLREMDGKAKETLGAALKTAPEPAVVRSAFDLPKGPARSDPMRSMKPSRPTFISASRPHRTWSPESSSPRMGKKVAWRHRRDITWRRSKRAVAELLKEQNKHRTQTRAKPETKKPNQNLRRKTEPANRSKAASKPDAKARAENRRGRVATSKLMKRGPGNPCRPCSTARLTTCAKRASASRHISHRAKSARSSACPLASPGSPVFPTRL